MLFVHLVGESLVDHYVIERLLGTGGMGAVYPWTLGEYEIAPARRMRARHGPWRCRPDGPRRSRTRNDCPRQITRRRLRKRGRARLHREPS
jgi:hypothetical protein